jgi:hypothetical protein
MSSLKRETVTMQPRPSDTAHRILLVSGLIALLAACNAASSARATPGG